MPSLIDIDVYGRQKTFDGEAQHSGDQALANGLILYLTSRRGDFYDDPSAGGALQELEFKPLSNDVTKLVQNTIDDVEILFAGFLRIQLFDIEPNFTTYSWEVTIIFQSIITQETTQVEFDIGSKIKQPAGYLRKPYKSVEYVGDNLFNFVELHLPEMRGEPMSFDVERGAWVWGFLSFDNLITTDPRFNDITTVIGNNT